MDVSGQKPRAFSTQHDLALSRLSRPHKHLNLLDPQVKSECSVNFLQRLLETVWYGLQSSRQALHTRVIVTACVWDVEYVQGSFMVAGVVQFLHS